MSPTPAVAAPRLSIVIPTLNRARLLVRALDSAMAQTSPDIEIIVSDNGSLDHTPAVLQPYSERADPRLRLVRHQTTMPADEHGNWLIAQCSGTFFLGLSDDDWLEPDFAAQVLALFDAEPGLALVYSGCAVHYGDASVPSLSGPRVEDGADFLAAFYAGLREVCWCACVTRLADLRRIGPIPRGRIFGDMHYWTQIAAQGPVGCLAGPLAHYTFMSADNLSAGVPVPAWAAETRLLAEGVLAGFARAASDAPQDITRAAALRAEVPRFIARSTANQFIWNLLRGAHRAPLWRDLWRVRADLAADPRVWPRALAALVLPRSLLRHMVHRSALARGVQRGAATASSTCTSTDTNEACACCGHTPLHGEATLTSLFLSRQAWGGKPEATALLSCARCGFRTYRRELSRAEAMRYYADYGSERYITERGHDEVFYTRRAHEANEAWQDSAARQAAVLEALRPHAPALARLSALDWGGGDGRLVASLPCAERAVFDFADVPPVAGVARITSEAALAARSWDLVLCAQTLEHISAPQKFLPGLLARVRPGGLLYLELPHQPWRSHAGQGRVRRALLQLALHSRRVHQLLDLYSTGFRVKCGVLPPGGFVPMREHVNFFTVDSLRLLAGRLGLQVLAAGLHPIGVIQVVLRVPLIAPLRHDL